MGKPMATNLINAGYTVNVYDINADAVNELKNKGASSPTTLKKLAEQSDIIITILPDSPHVKQVALGEQGLQGGLTPGKLFIDMSTIDAATEIEIGQVFNTLGVETLDAPVSGGQPGAEAGILSIMVGGSLTAFTRALPVFHVMGKRVMHMGANGAGQVTKSCSQIATALATQGVIESLTLAKRSGIDLTKVREALLGGFAESKALSISGDKMIREDFSPGFKLTLYHKDLRIAQDTANAYALSLPGTKLLSGEMEKMIADGKGDLDFSALIQLFQN